MAELLDSEALQHWLCDPLGDKFPLCRWLITHRVAPYVSHSSIARLHHHYLTDSGYPVNERDTMRRLLETTVKEMSKVEQVRKVHPAEFDGEAAMLWGKIASLPNVMTDYSSFDLIITATALRHDHRIIVGGDATKMEALAGQIPPDLGVLNVISADDLS